ncbi:hypothetical protein EGW08_000963 [Elysia chlorotica]|uniref:G-protein coupled receptors family 1 profile domain-containing protein n=1 Tax=Elysia chlorotica TaxID=188477 RepID=A0A433UBP2_ELYCH|nr:hypothetical protein EGW08_000963 [Elysia chlorotica]
MSRSFAALCVSSSATQTSLETNFTPTLSRHVFCIPSFNALYSIPVVVIAGLAGNLLALTVFLCSPLRRVTTSVYLAGQACTDLLFLIFLGINWLASIQIDVFALPGLCQTLVYVTYVVSFLSLWLIVALTFDLFTSIQWRCVHSRISRPSRALAITLALVIVGCGTYAFSFWLTKKVDQEHKEVLCSHNGNRSLAITGAVIDFALTLVLPFCLLIYMNGRILYVVASLTKRGSSSASRKPRGRLMRSRSRSRSRAVGRVKGRGSVSSVSGSEFGHVTSRQSPRTSQMIIQPSITVGSEISSRKRVSFEDERRVSLVFKEDAIRFDEENGNLIALGKIVVVEDNIKTSSDKMRSSVPLRIPGRENLRPGRSALRGGRKSSDEAIRKYAGYPIRRLSVEVPLRYPSHVPVSSQDESFNKYKHISDIHITSKRKQKSVCSKYPTKNWQEGASKMIKSARCQQSIQLQGSIHPRPKQFTTKKKRRPSSRKKHNPLTKLQYRCFRMVLSVCIVFLCLNVPSHTIRLQSLIQSLLDSEYRPTALEYQLQQFLQFIYYLNFVVNVFIYSACAKNFRMACLKLPWHISETARHICGGVWCLFRKDRSKLCLQENPKETVKENSRHVEICLHDIHLSDMPPPKIKPVCPPCLIVVDMQDRWKQHTLAPPDASIHSS